MTNEIKQAKHALKYDYKIPSKFKNVLNKYFI